MYTFRELGIEEIEHFWDFLNKLDNESEYMMYEPKERSRSTNVHELKDDIKSNVIDGNDFLQVVVDDQKIIGYLRAERGKFHRNYHTAYIVVGLLKEYSGKGIGTILFQNLDHWAKEHEIHRLELTVECPNIVAKRLYEKSGFIVEGIRQKSMFVNGNYVDEYYMAKML